MRKSGRGRFTGGGNDVWKQGASVILKEFCYRAELKNGELEGNLVSKQFGACSEYFSDVSLLMR